MTTQASLTVLGDVGEERQDGKDDEGDKGDKDDKGDDLLRTRGMAHSSRIT
jgi:hypothetical protein